MIVVKVMYAAPMSNNTNRPELIAAIASRQHTARELAAMFDMTTAQLRKFVDQNRPEIEQAHSDMELARAELALGEESEEVPELIWIKDKDKRLLIYQSLAERLFIAARITFDSTILRELRSYLYYAAQELGQLQHRGSATGDGTTVTYDFGGLDLERLQ